MVTKSTWRDALNWPPRRGDEGRGGCDTGYGEVQNDHYSRRSQMGQADTLKKHRSIEHLTREPKHLARKRNKSDFSSSGERGNS